MANWLSGWGAWPAETWRRASDRRASLLLCPAVVHHQKGLQVSLTLQISILIAVLGLTLAVFSFRRQHRGLAWAALACGLLGLGFSILS
jgi:hypothetical protein